MGGGGRDISVCPLSCLTPSQTQKPGVGMFPASPAPKILEEEDHQPPQIPPPRVVPGADTGEREESHPRAAQAALGEGPLVSDFFLGWVLCVLLKKTQNC